MSRRPCSVRPRPAEDAVPNLVGNGDALWAARGDADRGCGEASLIQHVATCQQGLLVVEGRTSYGFQLPDGRQVKGQALLTGVDWPWRESRQGPGVRYARLTATSPTSGWGSVALVDQPGRDRYYLLYQETALPAPRWIRAWRRRS